MPPDFIFFLSFSVIVTPLIDHGSIAQFVKKIPFLEYPFFPEIQAPQTVGHKSQVVVVKEVGKTDKRAKKTQHKEGVSGTPFRVKVAHKPIEEKAFQVISYAPNPGIEHGRAPRDHGGYIPGFEWPQAGSYAPLLLSDAQP